MLFRHYKHVHKIPKNGVINIIKNILENNNEIEKNIQKEKIHILETIIEQNYFQFDQEHYKQTDGLAMGANIINTGRNIHTTYRTYTNIPYTNTTTNNFTFQLR
jgi:hypothetical protein